MKIHWVDFSTADGGYRTCCGLHASGEPGEGPTATSALDNVTCKRCRMSESYRIDRVRRLQPDRQMNNARKQAWATRRKKYGSRGHRGVYRYGSSYQSMLNLIARLHNEGVLSEGQACKATGLGRIEFRKIAQAHHSYR